MSRQFVVIGLEHVEISMVATLDSIGHDVLDCVDLGEDEVLIEAEVPKEWVDKSHSDLALSRKPGLKPKGGAGILPGGDRVLHEGAVIVAGRLKKDLDRSRLFQPEGS